MSIDLMPGFGAFTPTASADRWNSADKSVDVVLSNSDITAAEAVWGSVRSVGSKASGKHHFEFLIDADGSSVGVGFANSSQVITGGVGFIGDSVNGLGYYSDSANVAVNFGNLATLVTFTDGDVIACEVDFSAELVWFAKGAGNWNNSGSADPATGTGGIDFSSMGSGPWFIATSIFTNGQVTLRTTAASFSRSISSGFAAWAV